MQITLVNAKRTKLIDTLIFGPAHMRSIVGDRVTSAVRPPGAFRLIITTPAMRSLAGRSLPLMSLCLCYMSSCVFVTCRLEYVRVICEARLHFSHMHRAHREKDGQTDG